LGLPPQQVYVVEDPLDIAAEAMTIGIASGRYHADELHAARVGHVFQSLTEPLSVLYNVDESGEADRSIT
jgi:hypothetical protein